MAESKRLTADDRLDIIDLGASYAFYLDSGDVDGFINNFTPDGTLFEIHKGHAGIRSFIEQLIREGRAGPLPSGDVAFRHVIGPPFIRGDNQRVEVYTYNLRVHMGTQRPVAGATQYHDTCVKLDGRWLIESRVSKLVAGEAASEEPILKV
jgi:hypothetical protein